MLTAFNNDQVRDVIAFAERWTKLAACVTFSAFTGFMFACGSALTSGHTTKAQAIGAGMLGGATMAMMTWRRMAPSGTSVAAPAEEAEREFATNTQVVSK